MRSLRHFITVVWLIPKVYAMFFSGAPSQPAVSAREHDQHDISIMTVPGTKASTIAYGLNALSASCYTP